MEPTRMIGEVTTWTDRAWGFVETRGVFRSVFLHLHDFAEPLSKLEQPRLGDVIEFELIETDRGARAVKAKIVSRAEAASGPDER